MIVRAQCRNPLPHHRSREGAVMRAPARTRVPIAPHVVVALLLEASANDFVRIGERRSNQLHALRGKRRCQGTRGREGAHLGGDVGDNEIGAGEMMLVGLPPWRMARR